MARIYSAGGGAKREVGQLGAAPLPVAQQVEPKADILVVDDDPKNLMAMEVALGELACRMVPVRSGEEALKALLERDFAVILLDVQMPELDGFETARLIRSRKRSKHVPIIFVTAFSRNDADIQRGYQLGAVDYLFKPIVPETLFAKVQVFLELADRTCEVARQAEQLREMERAEADRLLREEREKWIAQSLLRQNRELAEADRRKDEFLAMLAHELRNPLAPLTASLGIIAEAALPDSEAHKASTVMTRQIEHMTRIIDDLLDVSRISRGKLTLSRERLDLREVAEEAFESCKPCFAERRQECKLELPEAPVEVDGDAVRLCQVVTNLLNNASRYSEPNASVTLSLRPTVDGATLCVSDQGRGISEGLQDRIFEMFVQERDGGMGLGLGLPLVKRLTEMHGGHVDVHSDGPGKGSTFCIHLPVASGPPQAPRLEQTPAPEGVAATAGELRIALIEDHGDIRATLCMLLRRWGHTVSESENGKAGVELVRQQRPDLVLIDIGLPDIDGYETARRIRALGAAEGELQPTLVAVTGYGQAKDRERAIESGFDHFLVKPAKPKQLKQLLNHVHEQRYADHEHQGEEESPGEPPG